MLQMFWQKTTECPCTSGNFNVKSSKTIFIPITWLTANACHVNGTKHGSDIYIVGSYNTFPECIFLVLWR